MTERRRFFPARPVQQVPGQTVDLQVRLRPTAASAAAAAAEVVCTGWLVPWLCAATPELIAVDVLPDGTTEIHGIYYDPETGIDYGGLESSVWVGAPVALDGTGRARPIPGDGFVCTELQINTTYYTTYPGRHFMALAPGGTWQAEWDSATTDPLVAASGHRAIVAGSTLAVEALDTETGDDTIETLTATAYSGTTQVAQLVLRTHRIAT